MWPFRKREWLGFSEAAARAGVTKKCLARAAAFGLVNARFSAADAERFANGGRMRMAAAEREARERWRQRVKRRRK